VTLVRPARRATSAWAHAARAACATFLCVSLLCVSLATHAGEGLSDDQAVVFAPSAASVVPGGWSVRVQGRVFEPAEASRRRMALAEALAPSVGAPSGDPLFRARAAAMLSDSQSQVRLSVVVAGQTVSLGPSGADGCVTGDVVVPDEAARHAARASGELPFETRPTAGNATPFSGQVWLVPEQGLSVVSDMDDTIKVTDVLNKAEARANTFVRPFRAVPGMAELYRGWASDRPGAVHFHLVSAGPWQFHALLRAFTEAEEAGFPPFTWDMRCLDVTDPRVLVDELIKADPDRLQDFKLARIRALIERFPQRRFVLVGDSGERDPEVYAAVLAAFPTRVEAVFVRNVTGEGKGAERYLRLYPGDAAGKLKIFDDPSELPRRLGEASGSRIPPIGR
jgi:phosphatidate phosphatase APP1